MLLGSKLKDTRILNAIEEGNKFKVWRLSACAEIACKEVMLSDGDISVKSLILGVMEELGEKSYIVDKVKGSQKIEIGDFSVGWSYMQKGSVYVRLPAGYKYGKIPKWSKEN